MQKKQLRFYWWLTRDFTKKHVKKILLSFFISFFIILSVISFSSYLDSIFFSKVQTIGMVGSYDNRTLPTAILEKISYGLVYTDQRGAIKPALAKSWTMRDEGRLFEVQLKEHLTWDDGKPFTTADIDFDFLDVQVEKPSDTTLIFKLKKPLTIFPTYLTKPIIRSPLHGVIGQYKIDKIRVKQGLISELKLFPQTPDAPPLIYKFYDSETKLINAYKAGEIHEMVVNKKSIADAFAKWKNTKVESAIDYGVIMTMFFNMKNQIFSDKDLRQAFGLAIDRQLFESQGAAAIGPIPPSSWAYSTNLKKAIYDPDTATKDLKSLTEATDSAHIRLVTFYDYLPYANTVQDQFEQVGLRTEVSLADANNPDAFDLLLSFWQPPPDPDQYFFWHSTQAQQGNITGYKNVRIDKLLEDGRNIININERKAIYEQFQRIIIDDSPALFLFHPFSYKITRK